MSFLFFFLMIRRPPRSTRTDNTLSLHDALPITRAGRRRPLRCPGSAPAADRSSPPAGARPRSVPAPGTPACPPPTAARRRATARSEEHTSELQSLMRISYAVFCLKKKKEQIKKEKNKEDTDTKRTTLTS